MNNSELRNKFEQTKTFEKCNHWAFKFNIDKQVYFSAHLTYMSPAIAINAAWMMFQELNK